MYSELLAAREGNERGIKNYEVLTNHTDLEIGRERGEGYSALETAIYRIS